jgi:hypothetical protein
MRFYLGFDEDAERFSRVQALRKHYAAIPEIPKGF